MPLLKKLFVLFFSLVLSFGFVIARKSEGLTKQSYKSNMQSEIASPSARNDICTFVKWFDPNTNEKEGKLILKNCSSCHIAYYKEWKDDKHSMSQNNPLFLAVYKQFKEDHPNENGNCALCHNPEAAVENNLDLNNAVRAGLKPASTKTNGISCDFCHKIESVDQDPLKKGVAGLNILRVCKGMKDIRFGPIKDPIQPSDKEELKYNSLYKTSLYCAKCHDSSNGNVQIYSTFTEWLNSPASKRGVQCQTCHMAPRNDVNTIVDNPDVKHKIRPYYQIHSHSFLTEDPHAFRKKYVDLKIVGACRRRALDNGHDVITVTATVSNNNFGHSFPTGSTMRNAILLIEAKDQNGNNLKLVKGPRLPNLAGDLQGKPGKLFAKILSETSGEYGATHSKAGILFRKIMDKLGIPAQDWWNVFIAQDTRIKANESDVSQFEFVIARSVSDEAIRHEVSSRAEDEGSHNARRSFANAQDDASHRIASPAARNDITVTATLIWRNTWPGLAKLKKIKLGEDLLVEKRIQI